MDKNHVIYNKDTSLYVAGTNGEWAEDSEALRLSAQGARLAASLLSLNLGQDCIAKKVKTDEGEED